MNPLLLGMNILSNKEEETMKPLAPKAKNPTTAVSPKMIKTTTLKDLKEKGLSVEIDDDDNKRD